MGTVDASGVGTLDAVDESTKSSASGRNDGLGGTAQAGTEYFFPSGFSSSSATESDREMLIPSAFDATKIIVRVSQNNVDNPSTITVRKNGLDTGLSVSVAGNTTGVFTATGRESFTATDTMSLEMTAGAGATGDTATLEAWTVELES